MTVLALASLALSGVTAQAKKEKQPKHKKNQDLSANPLANVKSKQPDKELFDKAMIAMKKGRYDVARLDLQTMLNTYPDSEFRMRAKLAVGDSWFKEGGTAALTQAEAEYKDFITFFPQAPEAAEAQMKVGDIYYQQMEKPDRDFNNAENAEREYRNMINMFPDSKLIPRAKQKLRDVQEVLAERETGIGIYYEGKENYVAAIARLQTVVDTYPLYSKSDQAWLAIGDAYAGQAHLVQVAPGMKGDVRERLHTMFEDKAAAAYAKVITRYPMAPHVEDARDRLVAMNRPVPEPSDAAVAESDAEQKSQRPLRFTDNILGVIKHGPTVVQSAHVGEPSLDDPKRTIAPDVSKAETTMMNEAVNAGKPAEPAAVAPTGPNEPPRSDQPSTAPLQMSAPAGGTGVGVSIVNGPNGDASATPAADSGSGAPAAGTGNASPLVKSVGPTDNSLPAVDKPADAPDQVNDIRAGTGQTQTAATEKQKKSKANLDEESSSKKKKKKGLGKLKPF
ncbi:outer membrane protein assembly factor BamD [Occallatibacter savannae]|uniref:outer membrane protein assembly factor BamD n=1 Tax=Occallatibacter savannae TaxID=1002691 RepID=UPI0013A55338|nr:outer membrane protein assembly factor BamD [Occallatibacter savannae]